MEPVTPDPAPGAYLSAKDGEHYLLYFTGTSKVSLPLPEGRDGRPFKLDGYDPWETRLTASGTAKPGRFEFTPPKADYLLHLSRYAPGEKVRPDAAASGRPAAGTAPLRVSFSVGEGLKARWDYGDGATSDSPNPTHTYEEPGLYAATVTVTGPGGASSTSALQVAVEGDTHAALVRIGFAEGESHDIQLHGGVRRGVDGGNAGGGWVDCPEGGPWGWVAVGDKPLAELEGLRSFTIAGWLKPIALEAGSGGNRILCNLDYDKAGIDLVHLPDGRMRLAVNQWPDAVRNDSSARKLEPGRWTFFAVAYDSTAGKDNVRWYFGTPDAAPEFDRADTYPAGPTAAAGSGKVALGNYNETLHRHGLDRQFRGALGSLQVFGSRIAAGGALPAERLRELWRETVSSRQ
jgi:hypothetical protein